MNTNNNNIKNEYIEYCKNNGDIRKFSDIDYIEYEENKHELEVLSKLTYNQKISYLSKKFLENIKQ